MMEESRECKNCKKQFAIQPEDFDFYPPSHKATDGQAKK